MRGHGDTGDLWESFLGMEEGLLLGLGCSCGIGLVLMSLGGLGGLGGVLGDFSEGMVCRGCSVWGCDGFIIGPGALLGDLI